MPQTIGLAGCLIGLEDEYQPPVSKRVKQDKNEDVGSNLTEKENAKKIISKEDRIIMSLGGEVNTGDKLTLLLPAKDRSARHRVAVFLFFVHQRQNMFHMKARGGNPPFTINKVLNDMWFTNMYRELDRGTVYLRNAIVTSGDADPKSIIFKTILYRLLNKVDTFVKFGIMPGLGEWKQFRKFLGIMNSDGEVIFTGAHQVMGFRRYVDTVDQVVKKVDKLTKDIVESDSLEKCFLVVRSLENVGPFFAWQIVCDLMELRVVDHDPNSWTCLGPGAKLGLKIVFPHIRNESEELGYALKLSNMSTVGFRSLGLPFPAFLSRRLCLKNVEHALCEFFKFWQASTSQQGKKRIYTRTTSRSYLDNNHCWDCGQESREQGWCCVLCGRVWHSDCLSRCPLTSFVTETSWLCCDCTRIEGRNIDDDKIMIYSEVKEKFPVKQLSVEVGQCHNL